MFTLFHAETLRSYFLIISKQVSVNSDLKQSIFKPTQNETPFGDHFLLIKNSLPLTSHSRPIHVNPFHGLSSPIEIVELKGSGLISVHFSQIKLSFHLKTLRAFFNSIFHETGLRVTQKQPRIFLLVLSDKEGPSLRTISPRRLLPLTGSSEPMVIP